MGNPRVQEVWSAVLTRLICPLVKSYALVLGYECGQAHRRFPDAEFVKQVPPGTPWRLMIRSQALCQVGAGVRIRNLESSFGCSAQLCSAGQCTHFRHCVWAPCSSELLHSVGNCPRLTAPFTLETASSTHPHAARVMCSRELTDVWEKKAGVRVAKGVTLWCSPWDQV